MYTKTTSYRGIPAVGRQAKSDITASRFVVLIITKIALVILAALFVRALFPASTDALNGGPAADNPATLNTLPAAAQTVGNVIDSSASALYAINPELRIHHRFIADRESEGEAELLSTNTDLPAPHLLDAARDSGAGSGS